MRSETKFLFRKREACPSAEVLLAFQINELSTDEKVEIDAHLRECEFCGAELLFLAAYPPAEENCQIAEIPFPLRQLAEALLTRKYLDSESLTEMFADTEPISVSEV
jgi:hypothetical protein